ncbi:MAG: PKD domain-containing protein [Acidobacteria bacterium]|nr:PKD domain-containing protein [Acidobacteriota bacterium]
MVRERETSTGSVSDLLLAEAAACESPGRSRSPYWFRVLRYFSSCSFISPLLIVSLCLTLALPEKWVCAQGDCRIECTASVPESGQVGSPVSFNATATANGCSSSPSYIWDFGDGTSGSSEQNTTHTYSSPGMYNWKLTTSAASGVRMIDTVAGGYGDGSPAKQASITTPVAAALDPQGRGIYVVDEPGGISIIRFINTGNTPVTIAGRTIAPGTIRLLAGGGSDGQPEDVPGPLASFQVTGIVAGGNGDVLYFSDDSSGRVRLLNVSSGPITIGGKTTGVGRISTFALVQGSPGGIARNPATGEIYFSDATAGINKVYKISQDGQTSTAVAGNGENTNPKDPLPQTPVGATSVPLLVPREIAFDSASNLYIADSGHARVVRVDPMGRLTLAAQLSINPPETPNPYPAGLAVIGGSVYVANGNTHTIVRAVPGNPIVAGKENTICDYSGSNCGDGGPGANATFYLAGSTASPPLTGLESDDNGLYILDQGPISKGRIRYLNLSGSPVTLAGVTIAPGSVETIAGSGLIASLDSAPAGSSALGFPSGVAVDPNYNLYLADPFDQYIRFVNRGTSAVTIFSGTPAEQIVLPGYITSINKDFGTGNTDGVPVNTAGFDTPQGLAVTSQGLFVADSKRGVPVDGKRTGSIRFINVTSASVTFYPGSSSPIIVPPGNIATIAGGGTQSGSMGDGEFARNAKFVAPSDVAVNPVTGDIFIADVGNRAVRKINGNNGIVSSLNLPAAQYTGLGLDSSNRLYVADYDNNRVMRETSAGSGSFTQLNTTPLNKPRDVAADASGDAYVTNGGDHKIVRISSNGAVEIIAGTTQGFDGDGGAASAAKINIDAPQINIGGITQTVRVPVTVNIAIGPTGEIFFTDSNNNRLRRLSQNAVPCVKTGTITIQGNNPIPQLTGISPSSAMQGGTGFTLTVNGSGFVPASTVRWNSQVRPTTYLSGAQLTASIPPNDLANTGTADVDVLNPAPGGGASQTLTFTINASQPNQVTSVSAASFIGTLIADDSIAAAFGANLSTGAQAATNLPLPFNLLGTSVRVRDSVGTERDAPLFYVSPSQINYLVPVGTEAGVAVVTFFSNNSMVGSGQMEIIRVAPGLFSANSNGVGVAAANALRVVGGSQTIEAVSRFDSGIIRFVHLPIDLGPDDHQVFLILFGTGFRSNSGLGGVRVTAGGISLPVSYAGLQGTFVGLDQLNVGPIPRSLIGRGIVDIVVTIDDRTANVVQVAVK